MELYTHTSSLNQRKEGVGKRSTLKVMGKSENKNSNFVTKARINKRIIKNSMLVLLILAFLCVAFVCLNPNTRESLLSSIKVNNENSEEIRKEAEVYNDGSAILTDDSAVVESVAIVNKTTGTGPFDANDEPGNDSSATNNVVRSFDIVTYEIEANMQVNNTEHGSSDAQKYSSFRGGIINVEATIPAENAGMMKWSIDDMAWANGNGKLSEDGLTFTGQYQMGMIE